MIAPASCASPVDRGVMRQQPRVLANPRDIERYMAYAFGDCQSSSPTRERVHCYSPAALAVPARRLPIVNCLVGVCPDQTLGMSRADADLSRWHLTAIVVPCVGAPGFWTRPRPHRKQVRQSVWECNTVCECHCEAMALHLGTGCPRETRDLQKVLGERRWYKQLLPNMHDHQSSCNTHLRCRSWRM